MSRQIAPRLASGQSRLPWGGRLPPQVKAAIRVIAADEQKSLSWVLEAVVIDYFNLKRPRYRRRRGAPAPTGKVKYKPPR